MSGKQGKRDDYWRIEATILVIAKKDDLTEKAIEEELSIMCSRLEYRNGEVPNHVHISKLSIRNNG